MSINETATTDGHAPQSRTVVFIAYPTMGMLDLTGAQTVFWAANKLLSERGLPGYTLHIASLEGGAIQSAEGMMVQTECLPPLIDTMVDTLLVPGTPNIRQTLADHTRLVQALRVAATRSRRTAAVCSGTFLLAQAGLLEGRRAATHWAVADLFQRLFPLVELDREAIYVQQGSIWTSAGITAGIDLALALVEADAGRDVAMQVARHLVVYYRRPDNQEQWGVLLQSQYPATAMD